MNVDSGITPHSRKLETIKTPSIYREIKWYVHTMEHY